MNDFDYSISWTIYNVNCLQKMIKRENEIINDITKKNYKRKRYKEAALNCIDFSVREIAMLTKALELRKKMDEKGITYRELWLKCSVDLMNKIPDISVDEGINFLHPDYNHQKHKKVLIELGLE